MPNNLGAPLRQDFTTAAGFTAIGGGFSVTGGRIRGTSAAADNTGYHASQPVYSDQYVEMTITTMSAFAGIGAMVRYTAGAGGYLVYIASDATAGIYTVPGDVAIGGNPAYTIGTLPGVLRVEARGPNLYCFWRGVLVNSQSDTACVNGTPGILLSVDNVANGEVSRWEAGPLGPNQGRTVLIG